MRDYQIPITLSALHVYHSGVITMPECALRRQTTNHGTARLILERDRDWQAVTTILEGHSGAVCSVAFSSDGLRIVSCADDHTVRIWDTVSGILQQTLEGHTDWVRSAVFSSDGSRIVSGSEDDTVRIWDAISGQLQHTLEGHASWVFSVDLSPDGLRIVSGGGRIVCIWDTISGRVQHFGGSHSLRKLCWVLI
jgi:WD40 repeat protein